MKKPNISLYKTVSIVCMAASALLAFLPTAVLFLFRLFGWEIPIGIELSYILCGEGYSYIRSIMAASLLYNAGILVLFLTAFAAFYKKGRSGVVFGLAFLSMAGGLLVKAAFLFLANEGANIIKDLLFYIDKVDIVLLIDYLFKISLWFIVPLIGSLLCLISAICCFGKKARACRTNTVLWALHTLVYLFFKLGYYILAICSWFNPSEGFIMSSVLTGFGFAIITSAAMPLFTLSIGTFFKYRRKAVKAEAAEAQPVSLP